MSPAEEFRDAARLVLAAAAKTTAAPWRVHHVNRNDTLRAEGQAWEDAGPITEIHGDIQSTEYGHSLLVVTRGCPDPQDDTAGETVLRPGDAEWMALLSPAAAPLLAELFQASADHVESVTDVVDGAISELLWLETPLTLARFIRSHHTPDGGS